MLARLKLLQDFLRATKGEHLGRQAERGRPLPLVNKCIGLKLLGAIQQRMVEQQVEEYLETQRSCPHCGRARGLKGSHTMTFQTLFGNLELRSPRWNHCGCQPNQANTFSPLLGLLNEHVSPERLYLETKWGSSQNLF